MLILMAFPDSLQKIESSEYITIFPFTSEDFLFLAMSIFSQGGHHVE
jgi:hypothetical protein